MLLVNLGWKLFINVLPGDGNVKKEEVGSPEMTTCNDAADENKYEQKEKEEEEEEEHYDNSTVNPNLSAKEFKSHVKKQRKYSSNVAHGTKKSVTKKRQLKFECPSCDRRLVFWEFKKYNYRPYAPLTHQQWIAQNQVKIKCVDILVEYYKSVYYNNWFPAVVAHGIVTAVTLFHK